jgi:3-dehydroquinate synthase class II
MRALLCGLVGLALCLGVAGADDKKSDSKGKGHGATISKIDTKNHSLTVKMKDKDGKETEKTFKLAETVRYVDSTGKVAAADIFKSGDYVLVIEEEGQLKEVHQAKKGTTNDKDKK